MCLLISKFENSIRCNNNSCLTNSISMMTNCNQHYSNVILALRNLANIVDSRHYRDFSKNVDVFPWHVKLPISSAQRKSLSGAQGKSGIYQILVAFVCYAVYSISKMAKIFSITCMTMTAYMTATMTRYQDTYVLLRTKLEKMTHLYGALRMRRNVETLLVSHGTFFLSKRLVWSAKLFSRSLVT